jgi:hypothetical protein
MLEISQHWKVLIVCEGFDVEFPQIQFYARTRAEVLSRSNLLPSAVLYL